MDMDVEKFKETRSRIISLMTECELSNKDLLAVLAQLTVNMAATCRLDNKDFNILIKSMKIYLKTNRLDLKIFLENEKVKL